MLRFWDRNLCCLLRADPLAGAAQQFSQKVVATTKILDRTNERDVGMKFGGKPSSGLTVLQSRGRNVLASQIILQATPLDDLYAASLNTKLRRNGIGQLNPQVRGRPGRHREVCDENRTAVRPTFHFLGSFEKASREGVNLLPVNISTGRRTLRILSPDYTSDEKVRPKRKNDKLNSTNVRRHFSRV